MSSANGKLLCDPTTGKLLCSPTTGKLLYGIEESVESNQIIVTATSWPTTEGLRIGDIWTAWLGGPPYEVYFYGPSFPPSGIQTQLYSEVPCQTGPGYLITPVNWPDFGYWLVGPEAGTPYGVYRQFTNPDSGGDSCLLSGNTVTFAPYP